MMLSVIILFILSFHDLLSGRASAIAMLLVVFIMAWTGISYFNLKPPEVKCYEIQEVSDFTGGSVQGFMIGENFILLRDAVPHVRADIKSQVLRVETYKTMSLGIDWNYPMYYVILRPELRIN